MSPCTSSITRSRGLELEKWLEEGLAEYFSTQPLYLESAGGGAN